jgi:hypothetical protein
LFLKEGVFLACMCALLYLDLDRYLYMFRILYFDDFFGYDIMELKDNKGIYDCMSFLHGESKLIICIVDYGSNIIIYKGNSFNRHRNLTDHFIFDHEFLYGFVE